MFSIISLNATAGSKFAQHAGKVAILSAIATLIAGLFIYNLMGGPGSFLPRTSSAGYIVSVVALLLLVDTVRYALLYYKKPALPASPPPRVSDSGVAHGVMSVLVIRSPISNRMLTIYYDQKWTIGALKIQIAQEMSIHVNNFTLICAGKRLLDEQLVSSISKDNIDRLSISLSLGNAYL